MIHSQNDQFPISLSGFSNCICATSLGHLTHSSVRDVGQEIPRELQRCLLGFLAAGEGDVSRLKVECWEIKSTCASQTGPALSLSDSGAPSSCGRPSTLGRALHRRCKRRTASLFLCEAGSAASPTHLHPRRHEREEMQVAQPLCQGTSHACAVGTLCPSLREFFTSLDEGD